MVNLEMYVRAACPLCDRLELMIYPYLKRISYQLTKHDIDEQQQFHDLYTDRVPVLTHGQQVILEGRPQATQVEEAMARLER